MENITLEWYNDGHNSFDELLKDYNPGSILYPYVIGGEGGNTPEFTALDFCDSLFCINDELHLVGSTLNGLEYNNLINSSNQIIEKLSPDKITYQFNRYSVDDNGIKYLIYSKEALLGLSIFLRQNGVSEKIINSIKGAITLLYTNSKVRGQVILLLDKDFHSRENEILNHVGIWDGKYLEDANGNFYNVDDFLDIQGVSVLSGFYKISLIWYCLSAMDLVKEDFKATLNEAILFMNQIHTAAVESNDINILNICSLFNKVNYKFTWKEEFIESVRNKNIIATFNQIIRKGVSECDEIHKIESDKIFNFNINSTYAHMIPHPNFLFKGSWQYTIKEILCLSLFNYCLFYIPYVAPIFSRWIYIGAFSILESVPSKHIDFIKCIIATTLFQNSNYFYNYLGIIKKEIFNGPDWQEDCWSRYSDSECLYELLYFFYNINSESHIGLWDSLNNNERNVLGNRMDIRTNYQEIWINYRSVSHTAMVKKMSRPFYAKKLYEILKMQFVLEPRFGLGPQ